MAVRSGENINASWVIGAEEKNMNPVVHLPMPLRRPQQLEGGAQAAWQLKVGGRHRGYAALKRVIDIVGALTLGLLLAPLIIIVAGVVRVSSPGPVIFRQRRLTEGGREFMLSKFRTMHHEAERESGAVIAQLHDPRVTKVGALLRRTRLDELPQLLNVIRGDMSLIGPRPERPELAKSFEKRIRGFHRRLGVKAGLTGLAQVIQGYPDYTDGYKQKLALDLLYIKRQGLMLDTLIALKTIGVVLTGSGAR